MSAIKRWIDQQADLAGMEPDKWLDEQNRIRRDEAAYADYWKDNELCASCGWQGVPTRVRAGDECIDFCPGCGQAETFTNHDQEAVHD